MRDQQQRWFTQRGLKVDTRLDAFSTLHTCDVDRGFRDRRLTCGLRVDGAAHGQKAKRRHGVCADDLSRGRSNVVKLFHFQMVYQRDSQQAHGHQPPASADHRELRVLTERTDVPLVR
jgi:hypothetical protein